MNNKNTGLIATIAAAVLCGCPGLFLCIFGAFAATGTLPYNVTDFNGITQTGTVPTAVGAVLLCLALLLILIPVVIGFVTLRKKPQAALPADEPLPPAS